MNGRPACPAGHPADGYARLRPAYCGSLAAALALEAFARVGAWTRPLPPLPTPAPGTVPNDSPTPRNM